MPKFFKCPRCKSELVITSKDEKVKCPICSFDILYLPFLKNKKKEKN